MNIESKVMESLVVERVRQLKPVDGMPIMFPVSKNNVVDIEESTAGIILQPGTVYYLLLSTVSLDNCKAVNPNINVVSDFSMLAISTNLIVESSKEKNELYPFIVVTVTAPTYITIGEQVGAVVVIDYDVDHKDDVVWHGKDLDGKDLDPVPEEPVIDPAQGYKDEAVLDKFEQQYKENQAQIPVANNAGSIMEA